MPYSQSALRRMFTSRMNNYIYMLKSIFISAICNTLPTSYPRFSTVIPKISKYRVYHHTKLVLNMSIFFSVYGRKGFSLFRKLCKLFYVKAIVAEHTAITSLIVRFPLQAPAQYIRYTPAQQGGEFNSGAKQRVIR